MIATHKYTLTLEKYTGRRSRHTCPQCGKPNEFTRYVDEAGQPLAPHVGKCNRLGKCGYHYPPAAFFRDNPQHGDGDAWKQSEAFRTVYQAPQAPPPDYLPEDAMRATLRAYERNNFFRALVGLFGQQKAQDLAAAYHLGTSKRWAEDAGGLAVIFWQVDSAGNIRQGKVMAYDPHTGRRLKAEGRHYVAFLGKQLAGDGANLVQCFFGEHLLPLRPAAPVCLVESEKTAVLLAALEPAAVWLATGGQNGARWTERDVYQALTGRQVVLYPDLGAFRDWQERAKVLATVCDVSVSDLLERHAAGNDWQQGYDLADYFTAQRPQAEADAPTPDAEAVHATQNAFSRQEDAPPLESPSQALETPQGDEGAEGLAQDTTPDTTPRSAGEDLPAGFSVTHANGRPVLEWQGLPMGWLNDEEHAAALERMRGREADIFAALHPNIAGLVGRFNLVANEEAAV